MACLFISFRLKALYCYFVAFSIINVTAYILDLVIMVYLFWIIKSSASLSITKSATCSFFFVKFKTQLECHKRPLKIELRSQYKENFQKWFIFSFVKIIIYIIQSCTIVHWQNISRRQNYNLNVKHHICHISNIEYDMVNFGLK